MINLIYGTTISSGRKKLIKSKKTSLIEEYKVHDGDTGSAEVQIAILTERKKPVDPSHGDQKHDFNTQRVLLCW
jgi:small subunit ribosomal protein S15